jgi:hypothetical protein
MLKARSVLGLIAGVMLLLSSSAHMLLGWPGIHGQLEDVQAPHDLVSGLHVGWQFGGSAMIAFAVIVIWTFVRRLRGAGVSTFPPAVIGAMYVIFGVWAELISHGQPFFLFVFVVPGLMLAIASMPHRDRLPD